MIIPTTVRPDQVSAPMPQNLNVMTPVPISMPVIDKNSHAPVPVQVTYTIPHDFDLTSLYEKVTPQSRRLQYISPSNTLISITVTPIGGSGTTYGPNVCTSVTCTMSFTANPGPNTLDFTLTNGVNTLSKFSTMQIVLPSIINTLSFSANPVVNSVNLSLSSGSLNAGNPNSVTVMVNALDAAGNTITGADNYTDVNGQPLTLQLAVANNQAGGAGTILLRGPNRITGPNHGVITANYDGGWLDSAVLSVTASRSITGSLAGTTLNIVPTATLYSTGITAGANPHGITSGPDGRIWFTEYSGGRIGACTLAGVSTEYSTGVLALRPLKITSGADGNLYFGYENSRILQSITPSGTVRNVATMTDNGIFGVSEGFDGNIWLAETNYSSLNANIIARVGVSGAFTEFSSGITAGAYTQWVTQGPDGNIWFTENTGNRIGRITPTGVATEFSAGITAGSNPLSITTGPDNNLWFTEYSGNRIGRITPSGVVTEFSTGISAGSNPRVIVSGPDGNLWFIEDSGGRIARITTSGVVTEYSNGFGGGRLIDLILGNDGNLWYTDFGDNKIGKFVY